MRRLLLVLGILVVVAALLGPAALVWSALFTTSGLQFIVRQIPRQLGGVRLEIRGVSGTVSTGVHAERVVIDQELVHLEFSDIAGRVTLAPLLLQTIHVRVASVGRALIEVKRRTHPPPPGPPQFLPRWLMINVEDAEVRAATLDVFTGFQLEARGVRGGAVIRHRRMRIFAAQATFPEAHVSASGELRAADPLGMQFSARLEWTPAGQPSWTLDGSAHGDLNALDILAHATTPFRAEFNGRALTLTEHWHLVGEALVQDFDLHAFGVGGPLGRITGQLACSGNDQGFSAAGQLNPSGLRAGSFDVQFLGSYARRVLTARRISVHHPASGARAAGAGTFDFVQSRQPRLDLSGDWDDFRWPLAGRDVALSSAFGSFTLKGVLPYAVHFAGRARAGDLPEMPLDVRGRLGADSLVFDEADLDLYGGHASASGRLAWSPQSDWSVTGQASHIHPQLLRADLPGDISFTFGASGYGFGARGELTAAFGNLNGRLRGVAATGSGGLQRAGGAWEFDRVRLALGTTTLALDGRIDERLELRFAVSTQDLSLLAPGSRGELKASGSVTGTPAEPAIVMSAHGGDFQYQGVSLEALDAEVDFNPQAAGQESKIEATLRKLAFRNRTLETLALTLSGPPAAYAVHLAAVAPGLTARAQLNGAYAHGALTGELRAFSVAGSEQLQLALERPVEFAAALDHVRLEWLCLVGTPGSVCADGEWTPAAWSTTISANQLPLNTLTAGRTPAVEYLGTISALLRLAGGADTAVQGMLRAQLTGAEIAHRLASRKVEHTRIGSGTIVATASPSLISAQLSLGDSEAGSAEGRLEIERSASQWADMPISGELHAHTSQLALVSIYVPDIDRASGGLNADLRLAGTLGTPRLSGRLKVSEGQIDVYQVNLSLRQIALEAQLSDAGLDFSGAAHAGSGEVAASGHLEWRQLLPYGKFHLQGTNLRVADVPEAQIEASPDLDFTVTGRRIEVSGKVAVPVARIQPKDITSAVRASPDEVIVGSEADDVNKRFEVVSTITLVLGERVNLDAMGLTARLTGSVTVRSGYEAITRGSGELSVAQGQYAAYARKFDIERGRLIFTGGPIDNPGIDVRAVKAFPDVKAGINVRGTLLQPHMSFFSDPPLPQSQIVSLILAGGSLQSAQNAQNAAIGQGAALLAAELGSRVGLPDVSVETDPIANETSLVLGHYLSPRLYVSYGVSLTEQLNVFKMRYTLGDHWTVRTELGTARGADLVYSIEK
jgi:translocation and assembly module TamB